jgi:hypothetical protein
MTKSEFRQLFLQALDAAAENADARLGIRVPRSFDIELHAAGASRQAMSIGQAVDQLYLGDDRFYKIIDVAIRRVLPRKSVAFVRVSGHPPGPFSQTWDPSDLGPFKQVIVTTIEQSPVGPG